MRVLVTGASGFVGRHLLPALRSAGHEPVPVGGPHEGIPFAGYDARDAHHAEVLLARVQPDALVHLAGQAFVPVALAEPLETLDVNVRGTAYLLEALRTHRTVTGRSVRALIVSSAEVYGIQPPEAMPLREATGLRPANPYAASKAAAEAYALAWAQSYGLDVLVARAFNHVGAGQNERFVVMSFALQLAAIAAGAPPVLKVGNLEAQRDFLDVRDVVQAYAALLANGEAGEVYNVCSGRAVAIREILRQLITIAHVPVEVREDPARMRPSDVPLMVGDAAKLRAATGWEPRTPLDAALRAVYADACERIEEVRA